MNWRTGVRLGLAAVGLGVAIAVFVYSRRLPPPPRPPSALPNLESDVAAAGSAGRMTRLEDGKESLEITYAGSRKYDDGRMRFDGAVVRGLGDRAFTLRASVLETGALASQSDRASQYELTGRFTFQGSDGMVVESDRGSYDDQKGVLTMPEMVTFSRGRISGSSRGALYDRTQDTVTFLDEATARVTPNAEGKGAAEATAKRMLLARGQHTLRLEENARIVGESQVLTGQTAAIVFSDDETVLKYLELVGSARVTPSPTATANQPAMSGDKLTMSFQPDGVTLQHATVTGRAELSTTENGRSRFIRASWIDFFTAADGKTLTQLNARDKVVVELPATSATAGRTITAATLQASGDEKRGLTTARFEGNPRFEEVPVSGRGGAPAKKRTGTATAIVLGLGGQLDAIEKAEFLQNAEFRDDRVVARADLATYDDAKDLLVLKPNAREPRKLSQVTTADFQVNALDIELPLETEELNARGSVTTRWTQEKGAGKPKTASLFEGGKPVYGSAAELQYWRDKGRAIYTGTAQAPARLKQEDTEVVGQRIEFSEATNDLVATGRVDSQMLVTPSGTAAGAKPVSQKYRGFAETLTYNDARRVAIYEGGAVKMETPDGIIEAGKVSLELAQDSRTLDRMRAERDVFAALSGGYEVQGAVLVYRADLGTYDLTGTPAGVKSPPDKSTAPGAASGKCQLTTSDRLILNRQKDRVEFPGASQALQITKEIDCTQSLRIRK